MDLHEILHLDRVQGTPGVAGGKALAPTDRQGFQKLLDELQGAVRDGEPEAGAKLADFADQLRRADDDFATLMELRSKLEDAFRSRGQS